MNFYKHFIGDYARDTAHLSLIEHGAYRVLLDTYYATGKSLPASLDALYRIAKAFTAAERKAVAAVADQFFPVNGDGSRHNHRADAELISYNLQADTNRRIAVERERKRKEHESCTNRATNRNVVALTGNEFQGVFKKKVDVSDTPLKEVNSLNFLETGSTNRCTNAQPSHSQIVQRSKTRAQTAFAGVWASYPKKRSKGQAEKAWLALNPDEQLIAEITTAIERAKTSDDWRRDGGRYIPHLSTWLRARGWEDDFVTAVESDRMGKFVI